MNLDTTLDAGPGEFGLHPGASDLLAEWASHFICLSVPVFFCEIRMSAHLCGLFQHCVFVSWSPHI